MPWQETCPMDEKVRFIAARQEGTTGMAEVCRQCGISRKTGDKWLARYRAGSVDGLKDQSRARHTQARQTAAATEELLVTLNGRHPTWGPKKLVARLRQQQAAGEVGSEGTVPAPSTVGVLLQRQGWVRTRRTAPRSAGRTQPAAPAAGANARWCADCKGQFLTGEGRCC